MIFREKQNSERFRFILPHVIWDKGALFTASDIYMIEFPWGEKVIMSKQAKEMLETLQKTLDLHMDLYHKLLNKRS